MEAPRRYSVSPWYSFVTVTTPRHVPSFIESVRLIWNWLRGVGPDWRQRVKEERLVERLAEELEAEPETSLNADETRSRETKHRRDESHSLRQR
jgi:hypothetical protein